jgi:hypothetical protein
MRRNLNPFREIAPAIVEVKISRVAMGAAVCFDGTRRV